jgi:hypothetical protein
MSDQGASSPTRALARRSAASGCLLVGAAAWAIMALRAAGNAGHLLSLWTAWNLLAATALAVASLGIGSRSLVTQVFARGVALWVILLALPPWSGSSWLTLRLLTAVLSMVALRLAAPGLHTPAARAEFAPVAYRRVFLAGATAAVALGVSSAFGALWQAVAVLQGHTGGVSGAVWGPALLVIPCLASAVGVLRMRAWGVLLGAATAMGSLLCALPVLREVSLFGLAYVCLPGALLIAPVVASWFGRKRGLKVRIESAQPFRIGAPPSADDLHEVSLEEVASAAHAYTAAQPCPAPRSETYSLARLETPVPVGERPRACTA